MVHLYKIKTIGSKGANLKKSRDELGSLESITQVRLDTNNYEFEIFMDKHVELATLNSKIRQYNIELETIINIKKYSLLDFYPLVLIFAGIIFFTSIRQYLNGTFNLSLAMTDFMAGFFIIFALFKLIDIKGFADAYSTYDIVAGKWKVFAYIYPFFELILGIFYLLRIELLYVNIFTIILMGISSIGVIQSILQKRKIRCACLGTRINLPMTTITAIEDLLMVGMAIAMFFI